MTGKTSDLRRVTAASKETSTLADPPRNSEGALPIAACDPHDQGKEILETHEVLRRVAAELDRLGGLVSTVEGALPAMLTPGTLPATTQTLAALQQLDLIAQTVASLSGFLRKVTPLRPDDRVDVAAALQSLTLADMSGRLGASRSLDVTSHSPVQDRNSVNTRLATGWVELF